VGVVFGCVVSVVVMRYGSAVCWGLGRFGQGSSQASILSDIVALA